MPREWKARERERVKDKEEGGTMKLTEGDNCLRIMPNKKGLNHPPHIEFRVHRNVGPDNGFCACGKDIDGAGECWLCNTMIPSLEGSQNPSKRAMADKISSAEQFLVQVSRFDIDTRRFRLPKPWWVSTGGPQSLSVKIHSLIASSRRDYDDPVKGYNINIHRTGSGMKTRYGSVEPDDEPTVVPKEVLAGIKPLEEFLPIYDPEDQKALFYGRGGGRNDAPADPGDEPAPPEGDEGEAGFEDEPADEGEFETPPPEPGDEEEFPPEPPEGEFEPEPEPEPEYEPEPEPEPEPAPRRQTAPPPRRQAAPPPPARRQAAPPAAPPRRQQAPPPPARRAAPPATPPTRRAAAPPARTTGKNKGK